MSAISTKSIVKLAKTRATPALGTSSAAISKRLTQMELHLGVQLLRRAPRLT